MSNSLVELQHLFTTAIEIKLNGGTYRDLTLMALIGTCLLEYRLDKTRAEPGMQPFNAGCPHDGQRFREFS